MSLSQGDGIKCRGVRQEEAWQSHEKDDICRVRSDFCIAFFVASLSLFYAKVAITQENF